MIPIKVPPLGESIVEATVARWLRNEGDAVAAGDPLVELETDKITVEVPALKAGVLTKRLRAEGDIVKVDEVLGELDESAPAAGTATVSPTTPARERREPEPETAAPASESGGAPAGKPRESTEPATAEVKASPAARKIAAESGVDLSRVEGTGRGGLVSKPDIIEQVGRPQAQRATPPRSAAAAAVAPPAASPPAPRPDAQGRHSPAVAPTGAAEDERERREKMSTRRRRIAEHLVESQQTTASLTTFNEIDMTAVLQLRERTKARIEKEHGVKLTFMPFFVKAACLALKAYPVINARVDGEYIVYQHYINMGIAVASEQGLVVPNIRDAHARNMVEIAREMSDLASRARDNKLTMADLTGGTFTITNGGVFGSLLSTPILNSPQSGILGLHKIQERPVAVNGAAEVRPMMYIALSYDHRIVDGQQAVLFLVRVKELMEDPAAMLIE